MKKKGMRNHLGQAWTALTVFTAIMIILPLGLAGYEMGRYYWAAQQLRAAVDAAALAGVATLAGGDQSNPQTANNTAITYAQKVFQQNSIMGNALSNTTYTYGVASQNPSPNQAILDIVLLTNDVPRKRVTDLTTTLGKVMRITGYYGFVPVFLQYIGITNLPIVISSDGGVPKLDIVLCFDVSGSMDDETFCALMRRRWGATSQAANWSYDGSIPAPGGIVYDHTSCGYNGANSQNTCRWGWASGIISDWSVPDISGTVVNAVPPQNLHMAIQDNNPHYFTEASGNPTNLVGLRASNKNPETGATPGNFNPATPTAEALPGNPSPTAIYDQYSFTDLVVSLDQTGYYGENYMWGPAGSGYFVTYPPTVTGGGQYGYMYPSPASAANSYEFPNYATLVEASRGNLETQALRTATQGTGYTLTPKPTTTWVPESVPNGSGTYPSAFNGWDWTIDGVTAPNGYSEVRMPDAQSGYQAAYLYAASQVIQPMSYSRTASISFFNLMNTNTDAHFSLVAFSDIAGTSPPTNWSTISNGICTNNNVDINYPAGGAGTYYDPTSQSVVTGNFTIPMVPLSSAIDQTSQFSTVISTVNSLMPLGATDIADALTNAIGQLQGTNARKNARKAIILFTDGIPNMPTGDVAGSSAQALSVAQTAAASGIPIYTIGLSQNPGIIPEQNNLLGDGNNGTSATGIAGITGGSYYPVTDANSLNAAFRSIARSLVQLLVVTN